MSDQQRYELLRRHVGHTIVCVTYGGEQNVTVECLDCCEVIESVDRRY
jgi:hypothetical protein